jgi:hypothetical protein
MTTHTTERENQWLTAIHTRVHHPRSVTLTHINDICCHSSSRNTHQRHAQRNVNSTMPPPAKRSPQYPQQLCTRPAIFLQTCHTRPSSRATSMPVIHHSHMSTRTKNTTPQAHHSHARHTTQVQPSSNAGRRVGHTVSHTPTRHAHSDPPRQHDAPCQRNRTAQHRRHRAQPLHA